jgi:hypothetical protein
MKQNKFVPYEEGDDSDEIEGRDSMGLQDTPASKIKGYDYSEGKVK